ncbi:hypothetical protein ES705_42702 [subsurface metagenome]
MDVLVAKIRKNTFEEIQISAREYQGRQLVDIRIFVGERGQETIPTKKGISIPIEIYHDFGKGIDSLEEILIEEGLYNK